MRGLNCWSKNLIQVTQIRDTVAMPILNRCAKSCSNNPNRNLIIPGIVHQWVAMLVLWV